jgi:hypothetical protein
MMQRLSCFALPSLWSKLSSIKDLAATSCCATFTGTDYEVGPSLPRPAVPGIKPECNFEAYQKALN